MLAAREVPLLAVGSERTIVYCTMGLCRKMFCLCLGGLEVLVAMNNQGEPCCLITHVLLIMNTHTHSTPSLYSLSAVTGRICSPTRAWAARLLLGKKQPGATLTEIAWCSSSHQSHSISPVITRHTQKHMRTHTQAYRTHTRFKPHTLNSSSLPACTLCLLSQDTQNYLLQGL